MAFSAGFYDFTSNPQTQQAFPDPYAQSPIPRYYDVPVYYAVPLPPLPPPNAEPYPRLTVKQKDWSPSRRSFVGQCKVVAKIEGSNLPDYQCRAVYTLSYVPLTGWSKCSVSASGGPVVIDTQDLTVSWDASGGDCPVIEAKTLVQNHWKIRGVTAHGPCDLLVTSAEGSDIPSYTCPAVFNLSCDPLEGWMEVHGTLSDANKSTNATICAGSGTLGATTENLSQTGSTDNFRPFVASENLAMERNNLKQIQVPLNNVNGTSDIWQESAISNNSSFLPTAKVDTDVPISHESGSFIIPTTDLNKGKTRSLDDDDDALAFEKKSSSIKEILESLSRIKFAFRTPETNDSTFHKPEGSSYEPVGIKDGCKWSETELFSKYSQSRPMGLPRYRRRLSPVPPLAGGGEDDNLEDESSTYDSEEEDDYSTYNSDEELDDNEEEEDENNSEYNSDDSTYDFDEDEEEEEEEEDENNSEYNSDDSSYDSDEDEEYNSEEEQYKENHEEEKDESENYEYSLDGSTFNPYSDDNEELAVNEEEEEEKHEEVEGKIECNMENNDVFSNFDWEIV